MGWAKGDQPLRVMVGLDASETSAEAMKWVDELRAYGPIDLWATRLYWPAEEAQRHGWPPPKYLAEANKEVEEVLGKEVRALLRSWAGAPARVLIHPSFGRVADQLASIAEREAVDLLVVGSHRRKGPGKIWSVSHHILGLATMSVAAVPSTPVSAAEEPLPPMRKVLVATDFSAAGNAAVPIAFSVVPPGGTVHLLHVASDQDLTEERRGQLQRHLQALVPRAADFDSKAASPQVLGGADVAALILRAADQADVGLICLGVHGAHGLRKALVGSVAAEVLSRSTRPVLVVRPPPA
jgi:nucleotide-binding universal stress UspA family protein